MSEILNEHTVKTRVNHRCFGCSREFQKGTLMHRSCLVDSGTAWTCYLCETCHTIQYNLSVGDEFCFGDLLEEALKLESGNENLCSQ